MTAILNFLEQTGFYQFAQDGNWKCLIMMGISFVLMYLAIVKKFEPLLLLPIAFGMLMTNLPGAEMFHEILFAGGHVHWDLFGGAPITAEFVNGLEGITDTLRASFTGLIGTSVTPGLVDYLYLGVKLGIYPCLIFLGVGCMTDFGPLIANPKSLLLGAAAQLGIFMTYAGCRLSGMFTAAQASSIGIIGGADGPTAIFVTTRLAPELLGPIAVAAYSYMALVPVIQPAQNELMNIVTIFLGISVGCTATANTFLSPKTLVILAMGIVAFAFGTAGGVLLAKVMNLFLKDKINPLIGSAGVSAVPMAARVSQTVGQKENPGNFLLMHAMGPNVAGVIGSAIAAGVLMALFG